MQKIKSCYLVWHEYFNKIPKTSRYTLGQRIDSLFIELIESIVCAGFISKEEKISYIKLAIRKNDTIITLLQVLWESKAINSKKYIEISLLINEIGKDIGGWYGHILKQNSLEQSQGKK